jgi:hypothetical protein
MRNGEDTPDTGETKTSVTIKAGEDNSVETNVSLKDTNGDGQSDSIEIEHTVRDQNGKSVHNERHRAQDGETDVDNIGDGQFDETIQDNDGDGIPDSIDSDDDNDGVRDDRSDDDKHSDEFTEVEEEGIVEGIGVAIIQVNGVAFIIDERTNFKDGQSVSAIAIGDSVKVKGYSTPSGNVYAEEIEAESEGGGDSGNDD